MWPKVHHDAKLKRFSHCTHLESLEGTSDSLIVAHSCVQSQQEVSREQEVCIFSIPEMYLEHRGAMREDAQVNPSRKSFQRP